MVGDESSGVLSTTATPGEGPRRRERRLRHHAVGATRSRDPRRARAGHHARRARPRYARTHEERATREDELTSLGASALYEAWRASRIEAAREALAYGADWAELAPILGIASAPAAARWWARNQPDASPRPGPEHEEHPDACAPPEG